MQGKPLWLALLGLFLAACCSPQKTPFSDLGPLTDAQVVATLRARTEPVKAIYAELSMHYKGRQREGTFQAVFRWDRKGTLSLVAFKDLVLSTRYVFELELTPTSYRLEIDPDGTPERGAGTLADLARRFPEFALFDQAREALFLPGSIRGPARADVPGSVVTGDITWQLNPRTLEVHAASIGDDLRLTYGDYQRHGAVFIPRRVRLEGRGLRVDAILKTLELNPKRP